MKKLKSWSQFQEDESFKKATKTEVYRFQQTKVKSVAMCALFLFIIAMVCLGFACSYYVDAQNTKLYKSKVEIMGEQLCKDNEIGDYKYTRSYAIDRLELSCTKGIINMKIER